MPKTSISQPSPENDFMAPHIQLLSNSLLQTSSCALIEPGENAADAARRLYFAPFALLSHGTESDPIINYANYTAQQLFEMEWTEFTQLPSRLSAEPAVQEERDALLARVTAQGFIDDYSGIRIASSGCRFRIEQATVWNLNDSKGNYCGQAAMFALWQHI